MNKAIGITKPCSEDWEQMEKNGQTSFCKSCKKNVIDFSSMFPQEIHLTLKMNVGSDICGRIRKEQLDDLNEGFDNWRRQNKRSFQRLFLMALLISFGLTLFSCKNESKEVVTFQRAAKEYVTNHSNPDSVVSIVASNEEVGDVTPVQKENDDVVRDEGVLIVEDLPVYQEEEVLDVIDEQTCKAYDGPDVMALGGMSYDHAIVEYMDEEILVREEEEDSFEFESLVYPNPTSGVATFQLTVPQESFFTVRLFSLNGEFIRDVYKMSYSRGKHELPLNLIDLESGVYLLVVQSKELNKTVRIVKV